MKFDFVIIIRGILVAFLFFIFSDSAVFAQANSAVDSFYYYVRNVQTPDELMPLSQDDPNYKEPEAELTLVVYLRNQEQIKSLTIDLGNQKDLGDIRKWNFDLVIIDQASYLKKEEKLYAINNSKVIITEIVPASVYSKKMHITVKPIDKLGAEGQKKNKELN